MNAKNLWAWSQERFPAVNFISGFVMFFMISNVSQKLSSGSAAWNLPSALAGGLLITLLFFVMRVSDEHKDYELDLKLFPSRVLQSGRVTLDQLKALGVLAVVLQFAISMAIDGGAGPVTGACAANLALVFLLNREFFIGSWLKRHMLAYGLLHMSVAVAAAYWIMAMSAVVKIQGPQVILLLLPYWCGMIYEIARKSFGREENREGLESYSRIFGYDRSALMTFLFMTFAFFCYWRLLNAVIGHETWHLLASVGLLSLATLELSRYSRAPSRKRRKAVEAWALAFITFNYVSLGWLSLG